jgi:hypothetical protein
MDTHLAAGEDQSDGTSLLGHFTAGCVIPSHISGRLDFASDWD